MAAPALTVQIQGQGSVSADQLNTHVQSCDSVVQLRAFIGAPGVQVYLRGLVTAGDGGQGAFVWVANVIGTDDGVSIIVPTATASGYWERLSVDNATATIIPCTATGTNAIVLTPINGVPQPLTYANYQAYAFVALNTSTSNVTAQVTGLPTLNVYLPNNTQAASGSIVAAQFYMVVYNSALNAGAGGFSLVFGTAATGVTSIADLVNGGLNFSASTGVIIASLKVSDLTAATPAQTDSFAYDNAIAVGSRKAVLAGAANSLINIAAATKAQMQAGTDNTLVVTPQQFNNHDGAAKAWVNFTPGGGGATVNASYNVTSVVRNGAGDYTITFTTAFTTANYAVSIGTELIAADAQASVTIKNGGRAAGTLRVLTRDGANAASDALGSANVACFGRQ